MSAEAFPVEQIRNIRRQRELRHPEVPSGVRRRLDHRVGAARARAVAVQPEVIEPAHHDPGRTSDSECSPTRRRPGRPCSAREIARPHSQPHRAAPRACAADACTGGADLRPFESVPIRLVERVEHLEPHVLDASRIRDERGHHLDPLVFVHGRDDTGAHPRRHAPMKLIEMPGDASLIEIVQRAPEVLELGVRIERRVVAWSAIIGSSLSLVASQSSMSNTTRQSVTPISSASRSMAARASPPRQLSELMLTPTPSSDLELPGAVDGNGAVVRSSARASQRGPEGPPPRTRVRPSAATAVVTRAKQLSGASGGA